MSKQIMYSDEGRKKILSGIEQVARTVKVTMGPKGRYVVYEKSFGSPGIINDGATVAKEITLEDAFENMGARLVRQVAEKTNDKAGDGTTTATVLTEAIYREGLKSITTGANPVAVKQGIDIAAANVIEFLGSISRDCKKKADIRKVATISANDAQIGGLIADALDKVGAEGVVNIEEGNTSDITLDFVEGMEFDKGYLSPYFVTDPERMETVLEDCLVLLHEKKISNLREFLPLLEKVANVGKPLLIIAEDIDSEPLTALVVNRLRGTLKIAAVKAPGFGDRRKAMLQDMAVMTGGTFISEDLGKGLEKVELSELGACTKVVISKDSTKLIKGAGKKKDIDARVEQIRNSIETTTSNYDKEKLTERLAKLSGGVAIINAGAATETAMKEKKARIEDALNAARAATEEGILPGGGVAFIRAVQSVSDKSIKKAKGDQKIGVRILLNALTAPLKTIASNAGEDGSVIVEDVREADGDIGWDAVSGTMKDMIKTGIIDSTKVTRIALENSASIAGLLLTTETLVSQIKDDKATNAIAGAVY